MAEVWERDDLESTDKFVLLALADNANDQRVCWPSIETIARKTSLSERAVHYSIKRLEDGHFLAIKRQLGKSNVFYLGGASGAPWGATPAYPRVQDVHLTPAPRAPITIKEPPIEPSWNPADVFRMLLKTGGKEPKRTPEIQKAIDTVGGWTKIRDCREYDLPAATAAFCAAMKETS
jgi:DNA-binding Lrp family transcriptional regulator